MLLKVKKVHPDAILPTKKHKLDAGIDLYALFTCYIEPNLATTLPLGIAVSVPDNCYGSIREKGGGYGTRPLVLGGGVLDEGYTGELVIVIKNTGDEGCTIHRGEAIAQLIIQPYVEITDIEVVDELPKKASERKGTGGVHTLKAEVVDIWEEE